MYSAMTHLLKPTQAIDALGGTASVARLMGVSKQVVSNWRGMERFPAYTYPNLKSALEERGIEAPTELWRFEQPKFQRRKAANGTKQVRD